MSRIPASRAGYLAHSARNNLITNDEFPLLDFKELSQCLQDCDFDASEELVTRPSSSYMRKLFEQILDTFLGLSPDFCASTTKDLLKQNNPALATNGENQDISADYGEGDDTADTVGLLVFFRAVNMFLKQCGIQDFTLMDLVRPDSLRTQRVLSGVVNFARFREEHLKECDHLARESEEAVQEIRNLEDQNIDLTSRIDKLNNRLQNEPVSGEKSAGSSVSSKSSLSQLHKFNSKLEQELIKLQKSQEVFKKEHTSYKETKARLIEKLEDLYFRLNESERELQKVEGYASVDPELAKEVVVDLKRHSQSAEEQLKELEISVRKKTRTHESIQMVEDDLRNLIKIVQEISNGLRSLETAKGSLHQQSEELNSKRQISEELKVSLERAKIQLQKAEEKTAHLRQQASDREKSANEKFSQLELEYELLIQDRNAKNGRLDKIRKANSEIESEIQNDYQDFMRESRNTMTAVAKLNTHIRQYLANISKHL